MIKDFRKRQKQSYVLLEVNVKETNQESAKGWIYDPHTTVEWDTLVPRILILVEHYYGPKSLLPTIWSMSACLQPNYGELSKEGRYYE